MAERLRHKSEEKRLDLVFRNERMKLREDARSAQRTEAIAAARRHVDALLGFFPLSDFVKRKVDDAEELSSGMIPYTEQLTSQEWPRLVAETPGIRSRLDDPEFNSLLTELYETSNQGDTSKRLYEPVAAKIHKRLDELAAGL